MITNQILEDKWRVQESLSRQAGYDSARYVALVHERAVETQKRYGLRLRYSEIPEEAAAGARGEDRG